MIDKSKLKPVYAYFIDVGEETTEYQLYKILVGDPYAKPVPIWRPSIFNVCMGVLRDEAFKAWHLVSRLQPADDDKARLIAEAAQEDNLELFIEEDFE